MGKVTGFLEIDRQDRKYRPASNRIRNYDELVNPLPESNLREHACNAANLSVPARQRQLSVLCAKLSIYKEIQRRWRV